MTLLPDPASHLTSRPRDRHRPTPSTRRCRRSPARAAGWTASVAAGLLAALTAALIAVPFATLPAAAAEPQPAALPTSPPTSLPDTAADLHAALLAEIGRPTCRASSECRSVPVGHKACGGPEGWLASSTGVGSAERIDALAAALADARRAAQQAGGLMSTCSVVADPGARCRAGVCALQSAPRERAGGVVR